jgi:hypothetical protein
MDRAPLDRGVTTSEAGADLVGPGFAQFLQQRHRLQPALLGAAPVTDPVEREPEVVQRLGLSVEVADEPERLQGARWTSPMLLSSTASV